MKKPSMISVGRVYFERLRKAYYLRQREEAEEWRMTAWILAVEMERLPVKDWRDLLVFAANLKAIRPEWIGPVARVLWERTGRGKMTLAQFAKVWAFKAGDDKDEDEG